MSEEETACPWCGHEHLSDNYCGSMQHDTEACRCVSPTRPDWDTYFLGIAEAVAARADCKRARHGAVIVDGERRIVSTGYNGSTPGSVLSCLGGDCPRAEADSATPNAGDYSDCISLHAEQNAIAMADRSRTKGATIYVWGTRDKTACCPMCAKLILAAGIARVVCYP